MFYVDRKTKKILHQIDKRFTLSYDFVPHCQFLPVPALECLKCFNNYFMGTSGACKENI